MARPVSRPPDTETERFCGTHQEMHPLDQFTGSEKICRWASYIHHVKRQYGLSEADYLALLGDGTCPICRLRTAKYVDHDHETGQARGILCQPCNTALGAFGEDPATFQRALDYLNAAIARNQ